MSFHTLKDMNNFGFWKSIKHPIKALAPMAGVTDTVFRRLIVKYSKQIDVVFTEFVSSNGLFLGDRDTLMETLDFSESERPIVAQFFSANPERIEKSARLAQELGFDGVDLNLGCPDRTVCKQGAGSEIIKNPKLAQELILAMKEGAGSLPVSVKTRVGYSKDSEIDNWISTLLEVSPSVLTLHARTRADMYKAPARWSLIKRAVEIRDDMKSSTLIIGNGDISSLGDLNIKISESGADGGSDVIPQKINICRIVNMYARQSIMQSF